MIADVCLVLLLDASGSVDAAEWELQARATADALASAEIVERVTSGPHGRIAVTALEWSGAAVTILPWTEIAGMADARTAALAIETYQRRQSGSTAIGDALMAAAAAIHAAPICVDRVVDISGDGSNNAGVDPKQAVALLMGMNVRVNALVIEDEIGVVEYYEKIVSGFVLPATWDSYRQAIKAKLTLEIAAITPGAVPVPRWTERDRDWRTYWWPHATEFWSVGAQHDGRPDPHCNCHHWTETTREPVPLPDSLFLLSVGLMLLGIIGWSWRRR